MRGASFLILVLGCASVACHAPLGAQHHRALSLVENARAFGRLPQVRTSTAEVTRIAYPVALELFVDRTLSPTGVYVHDFADRGRETAEVYFTPHAVEHLFDFTCQALERAGTEVHRRYGAARAGDGNSRRAAVSVTHFELHRADVERSASAARFADVARVEYRWEWRDREDHALARGEATHQLVLSSEADALAVLGQSIAAELAAGAPGGETHAEP
jgi:hypothetical protein